MKMRLNEGLFEDSALYEIKGYYDSNFMELDESDVAYDLEDAFEIAWEYLSNGDYVVEIVDTDTGKRIVWEPDILDEFDGEFPYDNMARLMQKSVERNMGESMNNRHRKKSLKESLPKGKKGRFITDMYNAVSDVILKYEVNSWEEANTGDFEPSKKDIEFALDVVKRKLFASDSYEESLTNKPRRAINESIPYEKRGEFFTAISQAIRGVIIDFGLTKEAIINPELAPTKEDIELALELFKKNYLDKIYREGKPRNQRRTVNESLKKGGKKLNETLLDVVLDRIDGEPYNPREFYDYVNGWYNDVAHEMDEGEEEDVANAIIRGLKGSLGFIGSNPDNVNAQQLYKFVKDSTWLTNGKTGETPDYLKQLQNTVNESYKFGDWSSWNLNVDDIDQNDLVEYRNSLDDDKKVVFDSLKPFHQELLVAENKENGWFWEVYDDNEDMINLITNLRKKVGTLDDEFGSSYGYPKDDKDYWTSYANRPYEDIVESMNEDLESEVIDEPEKAEITWVDDSGEQKVSTVELINKSFPETALKFSKEHNDCSIINCTAPLKGAQKEDEPKEVPLTEGYLEANGLADRSPNFLYQFLGRLKSDCEYVINQNASFDRLWFTGSPMQHCALMREIYNKLEDLGYNPEDVVSLEKINEYDDIMYDRLEDELQNSPSMYESLNESEETDGLANLISNEINGEFETTNGYRNLRQVASEVAPDMLPVIDDIMDEENTHVGQLQTLLSMVDDSAENIDVGAEEAEDQLEDEDAEIEHNDEVDIDFADIKKSDDEDADLEVKDDFDFDDEPFDEE